MTNYFRLFENNIDKWYKTQVPEALIVEGARQVGKTRGILNWSERNNVKLLHIDLLQNKRLVKELCETSSYEEALNTITLYTKKTASSYDVIFLDEIQVHYDLLYLARIFKGQKVRLICSGSLLGLRLAKEVNRTDVGSKQYLRVYPLDFNEFLMWRGEDILLKEIDYAFENKTQINKIAHQQLEKIFLEYLIVGGMPKVASTYVEANNTITEDVYEIKKSILSEYIEDNHNSEYMGTDLRKEVIDNMDSIYIQAKFFLEQKNKRFKIDSLGKNMRYNNIEKPLRCLFNSNILIPSYQVDAPNFPLSLHKQETLFKLYYSDIGLLTSLLNIEYNLVDDWSKGAKVLSALMGGVIENCVAIQLQKQELYYYKTQVKESNNKSESRYEIDFLFNWKDGSIAPCEVKSRIKQSSNAKSFIWFNEKYKPTTSIYIGPNNLHFDGDNIKVPLYAVYKIRNWIKQ